ALPGGQIFITRAFLDRIETEGQLAGILGHQMGHVITRHAARQMVEKEQTQGLIAAISTESGQTRSAQVIEVNQQLTDIIYSRDDEIESDYFGIRIMSEAGYDPRAMISVMKLLNNITIEPEFFTTHPNPEDRVDSIREVILVLFPSGVPEGLTP
ncbi:MAG: M48 family metalloprotease, partial [Chloroflexota bacterium]